MKKDSNNADAKPRPLPPAYDFTPRRPRPGALAGFIACTRSIAGYAFGLITGLALWHH